MEKDLRNRDCRADGDCGHAKRAELPLTLALALAALALIG